MRLTRFTEYSLRVLIYLGQNKDSRVTINQISEHYSISKNHLMKVVSNLTRSGFVVARRGPGGGIQLNHPADSINLSEVINTTERHLRDMQSTVQEGGNEPDAEARLGGFLSLALKAYLEALQRFTLADILQIGSDSPELMTLSKKVA